MSIRSAYVRLLLLCACSLQFSSCFLLGPGNFDVGVTADGAYDMDALYVIVAEKGKIPPIDGPDSYKDVVHPRVQKDYEAFMQFRPFPPSEGQGWAWGPRHPDLVTEYVDFEINGAELTITVSKKLLKVRTGLVIGFVTRHLEHGYDWKEIQNPQVEHDKGARFLLQASGLKKSF